MNELLVLPEFARNGLPRRSVGRSLTERGIRFFGSSSPIPCVLHATSPRPTFCVVNDPTRWFFVSV